MTTIGLDPGTGATGWGVIEAPFMSRTRVLGFGTLVLRERFARKGDRTRALCERTARWLLDAMVRYNASAVACEAFTFYRPTSKSTWQTTEGIDMGRLIGELAATVRRTGIPFVEYPNRTVKATVAGKANATKRDLAERVRFLLGLSERPRPVHAADALAVALCHSAKAPLLAAAARKA